MTKDEICGLLRQIHDVLALQSETNFVPQHCKPNHIPDVRKMEPVAWMDRDGDIYKELPNEYWNPPHTPIYAQREWVGLTDEEAMQIWEGIIKYAPGEVRLKDFARAIEAKLKEKNT